MQPIILELPDTIKKVQIKDKTYDLDTDNLELCRKIQSLSDSAEQIVDGKIPSDTQIAKILEKCKSIIDLALGDGVYQYITKGEQGRRRYLLPLYVVGKLKDICAQAEQEYVATRYSPDRIDPEMNTDQYIKLLSAISDLPSTIEKLQAIANKQDDGN